MSVSTPEIAVRHCEGLEEFERCVELQRAVWQESIIVPSAMFVVARETGGQILGAFDGDELIGFTMALVGSHDKSREGGVFLHSHMTAVADKWRNKGVGRRLKLAQRDDALARGIRLIEWTFDPLELRNAYFNLRRLGAIAHRYIPNCYGITDSPLHAGLPTDRLVAEWHLDSPRVQNALNGEAPEIPAKAVRVALSADIEELRASDKTAAKREQTRIRRQFRQLFAQGYATIDIEAPVHGSTDYHYVLASQPETREAID